jgi:DNA-binding MarR family transcriptional regulator
MSADGARAPSQPETIDPATSPDEGMHRFLRCGHILSSLLREILEESYLGGHCAHHLTRTHFCLLKLISVKHDVHVGEVARYLGVTPAAISKSVAKLEAGGLVNRTLCSEDRRAILLSPTAEGLRLVADYETFKAGRVSPALEVVEPQDLERLCELLESVCVDILEQGARTDGMCMRCAGYFSADCMVGAALGDCALRPRGGESPGVATEEIV